MEKEPRRLIVRILEYAVIFALSVILIRLGVTILAEMKWVLIIIGIITAIAVIFHRLNKNRPKW